MQRRILIAGGGFTGLTAAHRLSRVPGLSVSLWEKGNSLGGLAGGFQLGGHPIEKAYHCIFMSDTEIVRLASELGLAENVIWRPASSGIYLQGRVHPFNRAMDLLRFAPCPWLDRIRTGLVALYLKYRQHPEPFEAHRAMEWMERRCGRGAARTIWSPLLRGKFARYAPDVSMAWLWARLNIRARSRDGGGEKFGYFRGGFAVIADALTQSARNAGAEITCGRSIAELYPVGSGVEVVDSAGTRETFDRVLFTGSSRAFRRLLEKSPSTPPSYLDQLGAVPYLNAICLVFASRQELPAPFWLNVNEEGAPFLVLVHHTQMVPREWYGGLNVYYIGAYLDPQAPMYQLDDHAIERKWLDYLRQIYPEFDESRLVEKRLFRLTDAQHVVLPGHRAHIPEHRTPIPGVYLANFSQVYPEDRGTNFAVRDGERLAAMIRQDLAAG
ncbi:MAG TPA: NAD(P)/FAD-dependent oxidoreductase [Candidatus Didemnitutus sp.]|nr:NAD(P)/FAD-dependent oxidoreductase [Candidatus Didemnitutus sp.]